MHADLIEVNRIRLEDDRTYDDLASAIGLANGSVLYKLIHGRSKEPHDRTLHKIRQYLDGRKPAKKRGRVKAA